jgi:hypothetical protein
MSWEPWTLFGLHGGWRLVTRCGPIPFVVERTIDGDYRSWIEGTPSRRYATPEAALHAGYRRVKARRRRPQETIHG